MLVEVSLTVGVLAILFGLWRVYLRLKRATEPGRRPAPLATYPSVTVIRPIKGLDVGTEANIRAALDNGYPGEVETLFVFDDASEAAVPLVQKEIQRHRGEDGQGRAGIIFCGHPPDNQTGKLNAMIVGLREAEGELVAFVDSDVRQDRDALRVLVETLLEDPSSGSAFAPVVVQPRPATLGDAGYALLLNGMYGAGAADAALKRDGALPFIMGQFMIFRREAIRAIGGLQCASGQLVDDMYLGDQLTRAGYANRVSPHPVAIIQHGLTLKEFFGVYKRWITFGRTGLEGWDFKKTVYIQAIAFWLGIIGLVASMAAGFLLLGAACIILVMAVPSTINHLHVSVGGEPLRRRHCWTAAGILLTAPAILVSILAGQQVEWRGRTYQLNRESRLA